MEPNDESIDMVSTPSVTYPTPAHSVSLDESHDFYNMSPFDSVPTPNAWYIIRTRNSSKKRYLSVINGKVCLQESPHPWGGFWWRSTSLDGWIGFYEFTTGRYLGHDGKGNIVVKALTQGEKERLVVSHQPKGGYHLSILKEATDGIQAPRNVLRPLKEDGQANLLLLELKGHATVWEFCSVERPQR
ncbi:hypothetical protein FOPG_18364 [Fusarium oxysporum f. sp. conglutinans race 2 54008]|uniref:Uncharacterized protein n=1 Tax=Fusarium oxysporum f. sp. conglutinans race 2 54008 TaxID=1089457 RepID=X0GP88_FUSOX|nr:hypothetical protein FOPG_18364 [Fusarium oxysporum f. sp. conglutinans race 2 54008]KAG6989712.1 hypothetical protein FocnCong_v020800 [Fusarium oxysporum f. sp. conglutinans]KAI8404498.1 hypothetical protein FOFC_15993 [Fusarium oxysporum]